MRTLLRCYFCSLARMFTSWLRRVIEVDVFNIELLGVVIMALINIFIKPLLVLITLPIILLTLGLFIFVINALLLLLLGRIAPGFEVDGFLSAFLGSVVISFLGALISSIELNV